MNARALLALLLVVAASPALAQKAGPEQTRQQFDEIAAADQALFSAFFDRCDTEALAKMVTDDFEMFHEVGVHRFFQLLPGKPEKLVEVSQFTHVWKKEGGAWKLARALSYDHRLTE